MRFAVAVLLTSGPAFAEPLYLPGTQPGELDEAGHPLDSVDLCRTCHGDYDAGDDYEPWDSWSGSSMAHATRDPVFLAALTIAEQDLPDVGEYCLRCHSPNGWLSGRALPGDGSALDPAADFEGVTCDACHRMESGADRDPDAPYLANAQYFVDPDTRKHGKYEDALDVQHAHVVDPFTSSSELCGTCHHVGDPAQPFVLPDGRVRDEPFPLETTYLEWAASSFAEEGTRCIDCHMAPIAGVRTSAIEAAPIRDDFKRHDFLGSNAWLGRAVGWTSPALGREAAVDAHAERTRAFLRTAATVEVTSVPEVVRAGETFELGVQVTNLTGHKLPTGYADGRRMWLEVSIGGEVVSGAYDEETAVLDMTPLPKIWEAVHGEAGSGPDPSLPHQNTIVSDDRIPPAGFESYERVAPVGVELEGNQDDVRVEVRAPAEASGDTTLVVRLRHQVLSREYVEFLRDENRTDDRGEVLWDAWSATGRAPPEELADAHAPITVTPSRLDQHLLVGGGCRALPPTSETPSGSWALPVLAFVLRGARRQTARSPGGPPRTSHES